MNLREYIKQDNFLSPGHEAMLNVMVTSSWILSKLSAEMAPFGVTPAQYNVLRILRGSHPAKMPCSEIGNRLLDRTPDVTRLLNRLEKVGLVSRERASYDRRVVQVGITDEGRELLKRLDPVVAACQDDVAAGLNDDELKLLSGLLDRMRRTQDGI